ncbi:EpsG family protein [Butyrivibrio sp. XB500-5]|nr:EpsG family protein [Butyrivibrio sp. XB500-5]
MQIYILTLALIMLFSFILKPWMSQERKRWYAIFSFILLGGIQALRKYTVGNDLHFQYYGNFIKYHHLPWKYIFGVKTRYEPGFLTFYKLVGIITDNPQIMIAVHSLFVIGVFVVFMYKNCDDLPLSIFLFVTMNHWFQSMVILRQILAVCFLLIATEILYSKLPMLVRYLSFIVLLLLAMSMHYSAVVGVVFLIMRNIKFNKTIFVVSTVMGGLLFFSDGIFDWVMEQIGIILESSSIYAKQYAYFSSQLLKESKYTMSGIYSFVPYLMTFVFAGVLLMGWRIVVTIKPGNWEKRYFRKVSFCGNYSNDFLMYSILIVVMAKILAFSLPVFSRFTQYFMPFEYVLLGRVLKKIYNPFIRRIIIIFIYGITAVAFIMMNSNLKLNARMTGTVPYLFFWQ